MENLISSIEKLLDAKPVYSEPMPTGDSSGFMQKMGKKLVTEEEIQRNKALNDFGYNQNSMNIEIMKVLIEFKRYCENLEKTVRQNMMDFQKSQSAISVLKKELDNVRLRSTLNSNQIEKMDAGLYKFSERLEDYALSIAPGIRNTGNPKGCIEADISETIGYYDKIENLRQTSDMSDFEKFCHAAISKSLTASNAYDEVVVDFYGNDRYAAVLYGNLARNSVYKINLLKEGTSPNGRMSIICTDSAFVPRKLMLKSAVIIITGEKPFEESGSEEIQNLKFLNDCGLHDYIILNESAYNEFVEKGFRCVSRLTADKLMGGEIVRIVEKAMDYAVPSGAVSFSTLRELIDNPQDYYLTDPFDISDYNQNRREVYPYDCLAVVESTVSSVLKNTYFPTGIVTACRVSTAVEGTYNYVDGLNYINHLNYENRKKAYERAKMLLEPDGIFVMNGYDSVVGIKVRALKGWNYYPSYEALWNKQQLINELEENGFKIKFIIPAGAGMFDSLPPKYRKTPAEWIIGATL